MHGHPSSSLLPFGGANYPGAWYAMAMAMAKGVFDGDGDGDDNDDGFQAGGGVVRLPAEEQ